MEHRYVDLRAVIFRSGDWWVGQCLEYDIAAQAKVLKDLPYQLERAIVGHIVVAEENHLDPFAAMSPAPQRYWKMFEAGLKLEKVEPHRFMVEGHSRPVPVPTPELRVSEALLEPA